LSGVFLIEGSQDKGGVAEVLRAIFRGVIVEFLLLNLIA
jgi:hypothetical protein